MSSLKSQIASLTVSGIPVLYTHHPCLFPVHKYPEKKTTFYIKVADWFTVNGPKHKILTFLVFQLKKISNMQMSTLRILQYNFFYFHSLQLNHLRYLCRLQTKPNRIFICNSSRQIHIYFLRIQLCREGFLFLPCNN